MTSPDPFANTGGRPSQPGVPEVVSLDQPFTVDGLYSLRAAVAAHAGALGAARPVVERAIIVASELASNAIRHGGGAGRLRLWSDQQSLHLQVSDQGPGFADSSVGTKPPDQRQTSGRGVWMCRQLCDELHIDGGAAGSTVTAVIRMVAGGSVGPSDDRSRRSVM